MKLDSRYEIRVVIIELLADTTGDCYMDFLEFRNEHPFSQYKFGYVVYDTVDGIVPDECKDWCDTPEGARQDYLSNFGYQQLNFPYVGIIYNWKGLKEENYLYSLNEIRLWDSDLHVDIMTDPTTPVIIEYGAKSYEAFLINDADSLRNFLTGNKNSIPVSEESESYESLTQEWYWESVLDNDFFRRPSDTMNIAVSALGINEDKLRGDGTSNNVKIALAV